MVTPITLYNGVVVVVNDDLCIGIISLTLAGMCQPPYYIVCGGNIFDPQTMRLCKNTSLHD